jgi:hypothetical protein
MSNPEAEVLIELSEELIWAFVRQQLSIVREISDRMKVGDFRFGMESAIDELDVRLTQLAFNCSMAEKV